MSAGNPRHHGCGTCGSLRDRETGYQKYGWEQDDVYLPDAASRLKVLKDFKPHSSRKLQLQQCPACGTYYLFESDYEFLVNGSEDEQTLKRLSDEQAAEYLARPAPR
jgi:hypothetical protein